MKSRNALLGLSLLLAMPLAAQEKNYVSEVWVADQGNGKYKNPILYADYSDPDACRVGDDFYMTSSSFNCLPGLQILHSKDLVNWSIIGAAVPYALPPIETPERPEHGNRVWAPAIRHHNGEFYIFWGDPDQGAFMVKAKDPKGPWTEPVLVKPGKGIIDTCPFWDEDGKVYMVHAYAGSRAGLKSIISICELNADATQAMTQSRIIFDGHEAHQTCEGPKLYKRGEYYYIFHPAGGVPTGWQVVLRSKNIYGPYEWKKVLAQGNSPINGPHQGAWVDTPTGEDWFLHFQDVGAYGRLVHLQPMKWINDWPVIGNDTDGDGCGDAVSRWKKPALNNQLEGEPLEHPLNPSALYQWHANYSDAFGFDIPEGMKRIYGHKLQRDTVNLWDVPNLWLQKFPAEEFSLTSKVRISAKSTSEDVSSGIVVMGRDYARLGLTKHGDEFLLQFAVNENADQNGVEEVNTITTIKPTRVYSAGLYPNLECDLWLKLNVGKEGNCILSYSTDGKRYHTAGSFKARVGKWIGAKTGFYSFTPKNVTERGWIDITSTDLKLQ